MLRNVLVAIVVVVVLVWLYDVLYKRSIERRRKVPTATRLSAMTCLLRCVSAAAAGDDERAQLRPFLLYGTLLGWVRSRDFICYDFDVDMGVMSDEYESLCDRLQRRVGADLRFTRYRMPLIGIDWACIVHVSTGLNLDLSPFYRVGSAHVRRGVPALYSRYYLRECRSDLPLRWFLPLQADTLRDVPVWVPHRPDPILHCYYGADFRTRGAKKKRTHPAPPRAGPRVRGSRCLCAMSTRVTVGPKITRFPMPSLPGFLSAGKTMNPECDGCDRTFRPSGCAY